MLIKLFKTVKKYTPAKYQWILSHEGFRRYFTNTGWLFFGQFFSLLASFFVGAWLARYLGPSDYGLINYAIAFVGLFAMFANLGVDFILNRELVKEPDKKDQLLGTSFYLKLIGGLLSVLFITLIAFLIDFDPLARLLIILFSSSLIFQATNVITAFFQARVEAKYNVKAQLLAMAITSVLKISFIVFNLPLVYLILVYAFDTLWNGLGLYINYRQQGFKVSTWRFQFPLAKSLWYDSWPLMLANTAAFIYLRIDQVMIGHFLDQRAVGWYAAAVKFAEIWYFLPMLICASLFPAIINAKLKSARLYYNRLRNLYVLIVIIALLVAIPTTLLAPWAVPFIFGQEYIPSINILQIYIWSGLGLYLGWAVSQYLIAENLTKKLFIIHLVAMSTNIGLNLYLIPALGLTGAAWTTLFSYLILPIVVLFKKKKRLINDDNNLKSI